jgi:branched-chain amino acid transport system permease protein
MRTRPLVIRTGSRGHVGLVVLGLAVAAAIIAWAGGLGQFNQGQLTLAIIYAIAIAGLNIATGYTGLVSVGHSAFFGIGAYTTGILVVRAGWNAEATIPVALVVCFAVGLVVGLPALRIRGLYLAVVTLALGVAFPEVVDRFAGLTGGSQGLTIDLLMLKPPAWTGFTVGQAGEWLYWLSVAVLIIVMLIVHNIVRSRYGLAMAAVRDNEIAAAASGVNIASVKIMSFGVSGALTGAAGSLFAIYLGSLTADDSFTLLLAITLLIGLIIGGQATRFGPIIGGLIVVYLPYYTSNIGQGEASPVLFGAALILIILIAPEGITGAAIRLARRIFVVVPATPRPYVADQGQSQPGTGNPVQDSHISGAEVIT